jgi:oxaloacetate decarboxylase alpha subunit
VLDRVVANGSARIALTPPPLEPAVPAIRRRYPSIPDEERLLRCLYAGSRVEGMRAAGPMRTEYYFEKPLVRLLKELAKRRNPGRIVITKGATRLELGPAR